MRKITVPRICFKCDYCGDVVIERITKFSTRKRFNCPKVECVRHAKIHVGSSNGMFGKTHTDDVKVIIAGVARKTFSNKTYENLYGKDKADELKMSRSISLSKSRRGKKSWSSGKTGIFSEETLEKISKGSSAKFTEDYLISQRKTMESRGMWIPLSEKSDYEIYKTLSNWISSMWELVDGGIDKIKMYGIFNYRTNPNGVVRDHMISRRDGLELGIFPEIIRHPCNCQILRNNENISKGRKSSILVDELFDMIESYSGNWIEQDLVMSKINDYRIGLRYIRKEVP